MHIGPPLTKLKPPSLYKNLSTRLRGSPYDGVIEAWFNVPRPAPFLLPLSRLCHSAWRAYASDGTSPFVQSTPVLRNRATAPSREARGASESTGPSRAWAGRGSR